VDRLMSVPWPAIAAWYDRYDGDSAAVVAVGTLTRHISDSPLATALHGWTSHHDLNIAQRPVVYPYDGPRLVVQPRLDNLVEFTYMDSHNRDEQWRRLDEPGNVVARLHLFLRQLRWVADEWLPK
jgi:hypothetical protein